MNILGLTTLDEKRSLRVQDEPVYTNAFSKRKNLRDGFIVKTRGSIYGGRKRKIKKI